MIENKYSKEEFRDICTFFYNLLDAICEESDDEEIAKGLRIAVEELEDIEKDVVI